MRVRFSARAAAQIDKALAFVAAQSPQGAVSVRARIEATAALLQEHPLVGQRTSAEGVRRIVVTPHPYFLYYRVTTMEVVVLRFRHAARRPLS